MSATTERGRGQFHLTVVAVGQHEVVRRSGENVRKGILWKVHERLWKRGKKESFTVVVLEVDGPQVLQADRPQRG
jgi:hypothetical protein